ncbi:methyltransferase [bacterium]|nr:methyltransferase [bacterium]
MAVIPISVTQNFLKPEVIDEVFTKFVKIPENIAVIDIGAGTGNITSWLAKSTQNQILAYELDENLSRQLISKFANTNKVVIQPKNFLQEPPVTTKYMVVANIPFMSTAAIIKQITDDLKFEEAYIVLQKEAAYRFGGNQMNQPSSIQSTLLEVDFSLEVLHTFRNEDFTPSPSVTSVLLHIKRKPEGANFQRRTEFADFVAYIYNKSVPSVRRSPGLGRYLARKIDLGRIPIIHKKPSELSLEDVTYLFSLCDKSILEKTVGYDNFIKEQSNNVQKIHRTRNDEGWRRR